VNDDICKRLDEYLRLRASSGSLRTVSPAPVTRLGTRTVEDAPPERPPEGVGAGYYPIHLTPDSVMFGPWTPADEPRSPCPRCLALRWQKLRTEPERVALENGLDIETVGDSPFLTAFALESAWQLLSTLTATGERATSSGIPLVYVMPLRTLQVRSYPLLADTACPVCSRRGVDSAENARVELVARTKPATDKYRIHAVADYDLSLDAFANPACGMLGRFVRPDLACPTTAPANGSLQVRLATYFFDIQWGGHADSYDGSALLGVFEGLERYSGGQQRRFAELVVGSYEQLRPHALDPRDCGEYHDELYRTDPLYTKFSPDRPMPWVWGYSLRDERPVLVPELMAYYIGDGNRKDSFVHECSNGCAGGSCLEEAVLHGMFELIERDAFLLAWYGKASLPEIDPDSCTDLAARFMLDRLRLFGYDVRIFDNRVDLPVPVVTIIGIRRDGGPGTLCFASGASLDPYDALHAALCEVASYIPYLPSRVAERMDELEAMSTDYSKVTKLADHAGLFWLPHMARKADFMLAPRAKRSMAEVFDGWERERPRSLDLLDDVRYCRNVLAEAGFDVIVVDQTSPEQALVGLHTARVIVPGLIPIDFGWDMQRVLGMPRLRTAFRHAGWRDTDLDDAELNYVPHPFP
jgi:ribosomal protein S12 methylthiotransferase accessory factor